MIRKIALLFLAAALLLPACKEEKGKKPELTAEEKEILAKKADEKIGIIIKENLPALFAGIVAFDRDVFAYQSSMLNDANISVLNSFGKAAILLLNGPDIPLLLKEKSVRKIRYLCLQGSLIRLDTTFEMELMRRVGEGKEDQPATFMITFKETPDGKDGKGRKDTSLVESAGYKILGKAGTVWTVEGPLSSLYRLLEYDGIISYELGSKVRKMKPEPGPFERNPDE